MLETEKQIVMRKKMGSKNGLCVYGGGKSTRLQAEWRASLVEGLAEMVAEDRNEEREGSHHYCFKKLMDVANGEGEGSCKSVVPSGSSDLMSGIVNRN